MEQTAENNIGVIQTGAIVNSVINQVVNGIQTREDIEPAIEAMHNYVETLQVRKGRRDGRIPLLVVVTILISTAIFKWSPISIPLLLVGFSGIYYGQRLERYMTRLNTELTAANAVLVELYKQKISRQLNSHC
jgi:hypothetical protein